MNINEYHRHRITHGVPEGIKELPPGQCLPFEINLDLMKGGVVNIDTIVWYSDVRVSIS